jgi:heavy metal sensor kinase
MRAESIRFRLTAWYAGVLGAVFVTLGALLFLHVKNYLEDVLLETQSRRARQIAVTLVGPMDRTGEAYVARQLEALYAPERSDRFIRLTRSDGAVIYQSGPPYDQSFDPSAVPPAPIPLPVEWVHRQPVARGADMLISAVRVHSAGGAEYFIEVGISAAPDEALFHHLLLLLALGLPVAVALAAMGGYLLVGRALRPVEEIAGKAAIITQHNLSERLPVAKTGDELERLSISLNLMIQRLDDAFQNSKRFVADASHELRTPLTVLRGELEDQAQNSGLPPESRERLGSLLEEVERLSRIVDQLLTLSRLDAGEAQVEWVRFDLADLAATTADQMGLLAKDKGIELVCASAGPVMVEGDRARMKQVVVNLLDNAIKYTPEGGRVRVETSAAGDRAILEVSDTGRGIAPAALPHIFERFYREAGTRARHPEGAGLGLPIVKSICAAHEGEVAVAETSDRGTRIRVTLPAAGSRIR